MTANIRAVVEDVVKSMLGNSLASQPKQSPDVGSIIRAVLRSQGRLESYFVVYLVAPHKSCSTRTKNMYKHVTYALACRIDI